MIFAKRFIAALFVAVLSTPQLASAQNSDQAYSLIGTWSCESAARSHGTMTFTSKAGSITMKNSFRTAAGLTGEFDEVYTFDAASGKWTWTGGMPSSPGFREAGTATVWTGDKWTFEGMQGAEPVRMIYTRLGADAFQREFEVLRNDSWLPRSGSVCRRATNVAKGATSIGDLQQHMADAKEKVQSYRLQVSSPMGMTSVATVIVHPMRIHTQIASGPITMEMYVAGGYLYQRVANAAWQKQKVPSTSTLPTDLFKQAMASTHMTLGPDRDENGTTYGSYSVSIATAAVPGAPPGPGLELTCTYDKRTFLTHECKNNFITETFLDYNDPNNSVTLPDELKTAIETPPIVFPGAPSPQPTH